MKKKTIVLDIDGTLTLPKKMEPTENVKKALQKENGTFLSEDAI